MSRNPMPTPWTHENHARLWDTIDNLCTSPHAGKQALGAILRLSLGACPPDQEAFVAARLADELEEAIDYLTAQMGWLD